MTTMQSLLLMALYGLCAWGAFLNFPAWLRLLVRRLRDKERGRFRDDSYLLTRIGLTLMSFGVCGLSGLRLIAGLDGSVPLQVPSPLGLAFIGSMALAEPFFLRVDHVHAVARGSGSFGWRLYWIGGIAWLLALAVLAAR